MNLTLFQNAPGSIPIGETGHLGVTVFNTGGLATSSTVTVTDTLPTRLVASAAHGTGWTCGIAGRVVTCTRTTPIASSDTAPDITIDVVPSAGAPVTVQNQATVQVAGDGDSSDDSSLSGAITLAATTLAGGISGAPTGGYLVDGAAGSLTVELGNTGTVLHSDRGRHSRVGCDARCINVTELELHRRRPDDVCPLDAARGQHERPLRDPGDRRRRTVRWDRAHHLHAPEQDRHPRQRHLQPRVLSATAPDGV